MDAKTAFETAWQHAQQRSMEPEYTGERFHGFHMTKEGITGRLRNLLWRAGYGIPNGDLKAGLDKDRIIQDVLSGDILIKRGIGKGTLREICVWLWPSNNGFHADRASGPDNSEHSLETRPAGEPQPLCGMGDTDIEVEPVIVEFPLRGEWEAEHTPAERIPSHGTDQLAQTYAYDFVRIEMERTGLKFFRGSLLRYFLLGVTLDECYGWSEPIFAPFSGTVVAAQDGWPERRRLHLLRDLIVVLKNALMFDPNKTQDLRPLLGNYVVLKMPDKEIFAFFAHARTGSIQVRYGDEVALGQRLAEVGHSGNSTAPHLHFHLMDSPNILEAKGLPCSFREYEAHRNGVWTTVVAGIPGKRELIRCAA